MMKTKMMMMLVLLDFDVQLQLQQKTDVYMLVEHLLNNMQLLHLRKHYDDFDAYDVDVDDEDDDDSYMNCY